jgi:hypothetical protein
MNAQLCGILQSFLPIEVFTAYGGVTNTPHFRFGDCSTGGALNTLPLFE